MKKKIYLAAPAMNGTEMRYIQKAFDTNWIAPLGENVDEFERVVAAYMGSGHAAALSSGTAALHLALKAVGVRAGDIVFCSDFTFSASCNPIKYENAVPVFIDSDYESWNMCPEMLERAFERYPEVKAVIVVNLYGTPARLDEIVRLCEKYRVSLIEDAAESLGSRWKGRHTGSFGRVGVLSFNGNKIITTSGGGMLVGDEEDIITKARFWATQSRDPAPHYQHSELGYNYRMSNICAGIGRGQMNTLDLRIQQKSEIYQTYRQAFAKHPYIRMNPVPSQAQANHWLSCITLEAGSNISTPDIMSALESENIESRPLWKPMSLQPYYAQCDLVTDQSKGSSVAADLFSRGLCLPSDVNMTREEQANICDIILSMF